MTYGAESWLSTSGSLIQRRLIIRMGIGCFSQMYNPIPPNKKSGAESKQPTMKLKWQWASGRADGRCGVELSGVETTYHQAQP